MLVSQQVDFGERRFAVDGIGRAALAFAEFPAGFAVERFGERNRDDVFELLQRAENQRAMSPWAGQRNIKMIAVRLGGEATFA